MKVLSVIYDRSVKYISQIARSSESYPDPSWVMHFRLGVRAEKMARALRYVEPDRYRNVSTQVDFTMQSTEEHKERQSLCAYSLAKRTHDKQMKEERRERLKRNLENLRENHEQGDDEVPEECAEDTCEIDEPLSTKILENIAQNLQRKKTGRRYPQAVIDFCYILSRYSMVAYNVLRSVLPLPSRQTLSNKYRRLEQNLMSMYENEGLTHELLMRYFDRAPMCSECEEIQCTIAVDAFSINLFSSQVKQLREISNTLEYENKQSVNQILNEVEAEMSQTDEEQERVRLFNNCFLVMLIPFRWDRPPLTISVFPAESGSVNASIIRRIFRIIDVCSKFNIRVRAISSDRDPGYSCIHKPVSKLWYLKRNESFEDILEVFQRIRNLKFKLKDGKELLRLNAIPIADPLHAAKIARSRVLDKRVFLCPTSLLSVSAKDFAVFEEEDWFSDQRRIARMSDYHAIEMFSPRVLRRLISDGGYPAAIYMWGWTALMMVIRVPFFSIETRLSLLLSSFHMFRMFLNQSLDNKFDGTNVYTRFQDGCDGVTFYETQYLTRVIHLIFAIYIELSTDGRMLRLSAFGTHANENAIGRARVSAGGTNNYDVFQRHFAKCEICRHLEHALGIIKLTRTRDTIGGTKLDVHRMEPIVDLDISEHTRELVNAFTEQEFDKCEEALQRIAGFLDKVLPRWNEVPRVYLPNKAANSGIIARLLCFKAGGSSNPPESAQQDQS